MKEAEETLNIIKREDIFVSYYGGGRGRRYITLNEEATIGLIGTNNRIEPFDYDEVLKNVRRHK